MTMAEKAYCPRCKREVSTDAPEGLCPECLFQHVIEGPGNGPDRDEVKRSPSPSFIPPSPSELARHFPQYEIMELLGQGGMGAVYKARQTKLDRLVAVKILPPEVARDPAFAERFTREARSLARLNHPNIVTIFDFGETEGLYYFSMEYVDGKSVRELLNAGELPASSALRIIPQVCDALRYAHDEGIVHRDIKPENILVDRKGRVKIADFGLARIVGLTPTYLTLTGSQEVMGTLYYMAPEQMKRSHPVDHRADLYSLGVVFYEMLTGELPVGRFAPPSRKAKVDGRLDPIVLRALAREPAERYQDAGELRKDIEAVAAGLQATPPPAAEVPRAGTAAGSGNWPTVRFTIPQINWWGGRARGEIYRDSQSLILEVRAESVWGGQSWDKEIRIPLSDIVSISCQTRSWPGSHDHWAMVMGAHVGRGKKGKRKWHWKWATMEIVIKAVRPELLAELPVGKSGRGRLEVNWEDRDAATELVESIARPSGRAARDNDADEERNLIKFPPDPNKVKMEVTPPAVGLALTALFAIVSSVGLAVWGLERLIHQEAPWSRTEVLLVLLGALAVTPVATAIGYLLIGAGQMMRIRSYPFALAAAILGVIPWSPAWILGLPFGIWALVILARPDVRAVFRDNWRSASAPAPKGGRILSFFRSFGGYFLPTSTNEPGSSPRSTINFGGENHHSSEPPRNGPDDDRDRIVTTKPTS
jgi:serine/threonine protein kinase